jgi:Carboxypeptidase regulatory-like domain
VLGRYRTRPILAPAAIVLLGFASVLRAAPPQPTQELKGEVVDQKGLPIVGAVCTLAGGILTGAGISMTADAKGHFSVRGLFPGSYKLTCTALGYLPVFRSGLEVTDEGAPYVQVVLPPEQVVHEQVEVKGEAAKVSQQTAAPAAELSAPEMTALPIAQQRFKAALPLVPGVVRTPDGRINIKGTGESQGMVLLNSAETVAPVTGAYDIDLPIDAIQTLEVNKSPFDTQYGGFSGGLTEIETKPPGSRWGWDLNDFFPAFRGRSGHLVGLEEVEPRLSFTGPLIKNKLNFSEAFMYELNKQPVRGLAWPHNETKKQGYNSFSEFQYIFSPSHLLSVDVHWFPLRRQFANINSLLPQTASSDLGQSGYSIGGSDRQMLESGTISSTLFKYTEFDSYAHGQGSEPMLLTPGTTGGNYFNAWSRASHKEEAGQTFQLPERHWLGRHSLKAGGDFIHVSFDGNSRSRPVRLLREDGSLAKQIDFLGATRNAANQALSPLAAANTQVAMFFQDHWALADRAAVEFGVRYSGQSLGQWASFGPRLGLVMAPGKSGRTVFRGGIGIFHGGIPLLAGDFENNPTRVVTPFDAQGNPAGPSIAYSNACGRTTRGTLALLPSCSTLGSTPYNVTGKLELDHQIRTHVAVRFSFLSSRTLREFIVDPTILDSRNLLLLSNRGSTRYQEFETTLTYHAENGSRLNISYVHSRALGDLNALSQIYVPFELPVIRPDLFGRLPSDIPDRLITWGIFKFPSQVTFAPIVDVHSGFPYSKVDVFQQYVGPPNSERLPTFFSFDFKVAKVFHVPQWAPFRLHRAKFRIGLTFSNTTNHGNPRDVYNNIASPQFGNFLGYQHRVIQVDLDTGN